MTNEGHGWVRPREDGAHARCGGPNLCRVCQREAAQYGMPDKMTPIKAKLYLKGEDPEPQDDDETALPISETASFAIDAGQRELFGLIFRPGDSLVLTYPGELSMDETEQILHQLREDMPGVNVVLLCGEHVGIHKAIGLPDVEEDGDDD